MSNSEGNSDSIVLSTKNKTDAINLRSDLMKNFDKLWVYVYNTNNEFFEVKVANNWGASLDQKTIKDIEKFVGDKKLVSVPKKSSKKEKLD